MVHRAGKCMWCVMNSFLAAFKLEKLAILLTRLRGPTHQCYFLKYITLALIIILAIRVFLYDFLLAATHAQLKESSGKLKHFNFIYSVNCIMYTEEHDTEDFEKLKRQLEALKLTLDSASDSKIELATIDCFKDAIQQYIERSLRANNETSFVKNDIERLCRVYLVIPTALWGWSMQEVGKAAEKLASERSCVPKPLVKKDTPPPSLFSKDTLYHACLCCEAISSSKNNSLSFFQCKRPQHSLTEVSFSQSRDGAITPYLIARQRDVIYVAFRSNLCVSEWIKSASSFEEG